METRPNFILLQILDKCLVCLLLLLSVRLCSVECSGGMLLPCSNDNASASGSGELDDVSTFEVELCPSTSTINTVHMSTQLLMNTITSEIAQTSSSMLPSTSELVITSSILPTNSLEPEIQPSTTISTSTIPTPTSSSVSSSITSISESIEMTQGASTVSVMSTPEPTSTIAVTTNQITTTGTPPGSVTTVAPSGSPSVLDRIREFFEDLPLNSQIGFGVGGGVVLLLLIIILCFCCCCVHSRVRQKKRGRMDIAANHSRPSLTISNPSALIISSRDSNEKIHARYRSTLHDSFDQSVDEIDMKEIDHELLNFPSNEYRESAIDDMERGYMTQPSQLTHHTQPSQMTQMSTTTDLFREHSLPRLSPLTCSSQILTAPQFPTHRPSLSVDENDPHMGARRRSLLTVLPNPSPSLNQPTLMALSLKNEESKSAHGSRASVQGSRTSIQGSRPSMLGSRGSVHTGTGSRTQIYSSNPSSREHSVLHLNGVREFGVSEEDALSLPLSGRGISPALKESSFEEVPTRDSPGPETASHAAAGYRKKDFASLTCIPNQYAVEAERLEERRQLSTVPEKQSTDEIKEKEATNEETKKKPRSRAMSKLEKLTSLDYIRASLRLKKKKVSFVKTPESAKKEKQKNDKAKSSPEEKAQAPAPSNHASPKYPGKEYHQNRRHSASARTEFSPQHVHQDLPTNKYPDHYYYPQLQLSQPLYYGAAGGGAGGGAMHPATAAMFYQYPQLSQQYYVQLSQGGYGAGPYPPHMLNVMDPYGRSYGEPSTPARYQPIDTPDLFDDDTPEPEFYQERSPDNILQQRQQPNGFSDSIHSPGHSSMQPPSPDRFTETSDTSSYAAPPPPGSTSHTHEDSITSAHKHFMDEFVMDGADLHYGYGAGEQYHIHGHPVPTYPGDMLNRAGHTPHEAYRDIYQHQQHGDVAMGPIDYDITAGQTNGHYYSHYTSPTAYSAVPPGKGVGGRRPSRSSYASSSSDHAHLESVEEGEGESRPAVKSEDMNGSGTKNRVSWSTEVIEYQRTPSDLAESDFDFNQF